MRVRAAGVVVLLSVVWVGVVVGSVQGLTIRLNAHAEECFFHQVEAERVQQGHITFGFLVLKGGQLDVDVQVVSPSDRILHSYTRATEAEQSFTPEEQGVYKICFSNKMSTITKKAVSFYFEEKDDTAPVVDRLRKNRVAASAGQQKKDAHADMQQISSMESSIMTLADKLETISYNQRHLRHRDIRHYSTTESTYSRLFWWSIVVTVVLIGMAFGQLYYLKRKMGASSFLELGHV